MCYNKILSIGVCMKNFDDVNGQIIGGDYGQAWVTYEGRQQGKMNYPYNECEAYAMCDAVVESIKKDCGEAFKLIYPNQSWKFHFDGV